MAMKQSVGKRAGVTVLAWVVAFLIFFPILWTFLTSFKSELDAIAMPPKFLFFNWTLENYAEVQNRSNYLHYALNSILLSIGANVIGLLISIPAAWSMAFAPTKRTKDVLDVDAVDQDDARGRRAGADLSPVSRHASAR